VVWQPLAVILGLVALIMLLLAISAPVWLESDLEAMGIEAYLADASALENIGTTLWLMAVPLAVIFGATAAGVASNARTGRIVGFVIAAVAAVILPIIVGNILGEVVPSVFGAGGILIEIFLVLTVWFWAQQRVQITGRKRLALDLRMAGYGMFATAAWFVCGMLAMPGFGLDPATQMEIGNTTFNLSMAYGLISYLALGWALSFASQYITARDEAA
jgi:hypothetical protein